MQQLLVIRFGALGDLCLLAWSLAAFATDETEKNPRWQVTLVTKPAYTDLMSQVPGVTEVIPLAGKGLQDLRHLTGVLRERTFSGVIDAHNNLRSRLLTMMLHRSPDRRLAKDTAARLAFLLWRKSSAGLERTMQQRFQELLQPYLPRTAGAATFSGVLEPPLAHLGGDPAAEPLVLGLAPGAHWDTKRWPEQYFCELLNEFRKVSPALVRLYLGPREQSWFPNSQLDRLARNRDGVEIWQHKSLIEVASSLAGCDLLVTNDSGLLHLAEAAGTPVLALFGPTVQEFGYFPSLPTSRVLQTELGCRPCSRNGKRPCHRRDLACLTEIKLATVMSNLLEMGSRTSGDG